MPIINTPYGQWDLPAQWDENNGFGFRAIDTVEGLQIVRLYAPAYALVLMAQAAASGTGADATAAQAARDAALVAQGLSEDARDTSVAAAAAAEGFRDEAEGFRNQAAASAAGVNLPAINPGDAGKYLRAKGNESGFELAGANTAVGDPVALVDVGGNPGLPAVDGSQLTGIVPPRPVDAKSANYTVIAGDAGKALSCTSTFTLSLTAAATLGNGFVVGIVNAGAGVITIDPDDSETIDGRATIKVYAGERFDIVCDGTTWRTLGRSRQPVLVSTVLSTAVAQVDFEVGFDDDEITKLSIDALITQTGANDDRNLQVRFKKSGSYITGGSYTHRYSRLDNTYSGARSVGQSSIDTQVQVDINEWVWVKFDISPTRGSTPGTAVQFVQGMGAGNGGDRTAVFHGFETTAAALQGVRMYLSNENFAANSRFALIAHRGL